MNIFSISYHSFAFLPCFNVRKILDFSECWLIFHSKCRRLYHKMSYYFNALAGTPESVLFAAHGQLRSDRDDKSFKCAMLSICKTLIELGQLH